MKPNKDPLKCSVCGRKSWGGEYKGKGCLMPQPDGTKCAGLLAPAMAITDKHTLSPACVLVNLKTIIKELDELRLYKAEHERLKKGLNEILHPDGIMPKAPSFCDLLCYVEGDLRKLRREISELKRHRPPTQRSMSQ